MTQWLFVPTNLPPTHGSFGPDEMEALDDMLSFHERAFELARKRLGLSKVPDVVRVRAANAEHMRRKLSLVVDRARKELGV